jgi:hypothetical protein
VGTRTNTSGAEAGLAAGRPLAEGAEQAERQESEERGSTTEVIAVLTVESRRVAGRVLAARIALLPARPAVAPLAAPAHRVALAGEAVAMSEESTPIHLSQVRPRRK